MKVFVLRTHGTSRVGSRSNGVVRPPPTQVSVVLAGDFNSTPESGVVEFLEKGGVRADHNDFQVGQGGLGVTRLF